MVGQQKLWVSKLVRCVYSHLCTDVCPESTDHTRSSLLVVSFRTTKPIPRTRNLQQDRSTGINGRSQITEAEKTGEQSRKKSHRGPLETSRKVTKKLGRDRDGKWRTTKGVVNGLLDPKRGGRRGTNRNIGSTMRQGV